MSLDVTLQRVDKPLQKRVRPEGAERESFLEEATFRHSKLASGKGRSSQCNVILLIDSSLQGCIWGEQEIIQSPLSSVWLWDALFGRAGKQRGGSGL